jgi:hypothetical protein
MHFNRMFVQLVFINGRPCCRGPIHKALSQAYKATAASMSSAVQTAMDISENGLGMPQRKKRRRENNVDDNSAPAVIHEGHPLFLVMVKCPVAECSFSVASDPGSVITVL